MRREEDRQLVWLEFELEVEEAERRSGVVDMRRSCRRRCRAPSTRALAFHGWLQQWRDGRALLQCPIERYQAQRNEGAVA